jgi:type II secretory pathway pseudopilin PulG
MLVVISIILIVAVVALPAITSLSKGAARRSSVSLVMAALDQARAQAVGQSANCYFVFANNDSQLVFSSGSGKPPEDFRYRAFAIFQEVYIPPKSTATGDAANQPYHLLPIRAWTLLPDGVAFRPANQTTATSGGSSASTTVKTVFDAMNSTAAPSSTSTTTTTTPTSFYFQPSNASIVLPFIKFNPTGGIDAIGNYTATSAGDYANVKIFEGFVDANGNAVVTNPAKALADETINLSLFTGRAKRQELNVTN